MRSQNMVYEGLTKEQRSILCELECALSQLEFYYDTNAIALRDRSGSRYTTVDAADVLALIEAGAIAYAGKFNEGRGSRYKITWRVREEALAAGVNLNDAQASTTDYRNELLKLRVGVARVAQLLKLDTEIPGCPVGDFTSLYTSAETYERGWNRLLACIADEVAARQPRRDREPLGLLEEDDLGDI